MICVEKVLHEAIFAVLPFQSTNSVEIRQERGSRKNSPVARSKKAARGGKTVTKACSFKFS